MSYLESDDHLASGESHEHVRHLSICRGSDFAFTKFVTFCCIEAGRD